MRARVIRAKVVFILVTLGLMLAVTASPVAAGGGGVVVGTPEGEIGGGFFSMTGTGAWSGPLAGICSTGQSARRALQLRFQPCL